jgi:uncharacterized membrane protein
MHMLEQHVASDGFGLRGTAASRLEGFSDVVLGFALTLLVVSLEVPRTYAELHASMRSFVPFAICFFFLLSIWYSHFKFFRRYGLHDTATVVLNSFLLFVVLFYVYPLKFLFTALTNGWIGGDASAFGTPGQMRWLMLLYGVGFTSVYLLFAALYWNAWRRRASLDLNPLERFLTRSAVAEHLLQASVGVLSCVTALLLPENYAGVAGMEYLLVAVTGSLHGRWERRNIAALRVPAPEPATD